LANLGNPMSALNKSNPVCR